MISRATRVWKAVNVSGTKVALKDAWIDDDRSMEHEIQHRMLEDVKAELGEEIMNDVRKHLLIHLGACKIKIDGKEDNTKNFIMRGGEGPSFDRRFPLIQYRPEWRMQSTGSSSATDTTSQLATDSTVPKQTCLCHRVHYRIAFKEVAQPIDMETKLSHVFLVLRDVTQGKILLFPQHYTKHDFIVLEHIHKAGWVHRDISAGNIHYYRDRGLLGDLEYAKKMGTDATHEVRTVW